MDMSSYVLVMVCVNVKLCLSIVVWTCKVMFEFCCADKVV